MAPIAQTQAAAHCSEPTGSCPVVFAGALWPGRGCLGCWWVVFCSCFFGGVVFLRVLCFNQFLSFFLGGIVHFFCVVLLIFVGISGVFVFGHFGGYFFCYRFSDLFYCNGEPRHVGLDA